MHLFNQYGPWLPKKDMKLTLAIRRFLFDAEIEIQRRWQFKKSIKTDDCAISCHVMARVVAHFFDVAVCDGYIKPGHGQVSFAHSWCVTPRNHIVDIVPIGVFCGPILLVKDGELSFLHQQYISSSGPGKKALVRINGAKTKRRIETWVGNILAPDSGVIKNLDSVWRKEMRPEFR